MNSKSGNLFIEMQWTLVECEGRQPHKSNCPILKGYHRHKMITSQNVPYEVQFGDFFVSKKSYVPFSRYSNFCIFDHPMIYQICDVIMSISIWDRVHFWIYLLNNNSLTHQNWSINRYKQGQYFSEVFWTIWRTFPIYQIAPITQ